MLLAIFMNISCQGNDAADEFLVEEEIIETENTNTGIESE